MPYTHTTLAQAKSQLARRLRDTPNTFWTDAALYSDLGYLISEALYTWQLLTGYWRERGVCTTAAGTAFYDLESKLPALVGNTITSRQAIAAIQHRLLEPATPLAWSGSSMFTLNDLVVAIQNRRNRLLVDTGALVRAIDQPMAPVPTGRQQLPQDTIDVLRASWLDMDGNYTTLWRDNEFDANAYTPGWSVSPGTPERFSIISTPPLTLQVIPPPIDMGVLELVVVQAPADVDPITTNALINIPDNMVWIAQWGAISDLLMREGEANDPLRGQFAQSIYDYGVKVAAQNKIAINFEIQGVPVLASSVFDADTYDPDWRNSSDEPETILLIGQNLVAADPVPDGIYSMTFDVIRRAPIPANDAAYLQVGREDLDVILGYVEVLAAFKQGGQEFAATLPLLQSFVKQAAGYNSRLSELNATVLDSMQSLPQISPQSQPIATAIPED